MSTHIYSQSGKDAGTSYLPGMKIPEGCYAAYYEILWGDRNVYKGNGFTGRFGTATYTVTTYGRDGQYVIDVRSFNGYHLDTAVEHCLRRIGFEVENFNPVLPTLTSVFARLAWLARWVFTGKQA